MNGLRDVIDGYDCGVRHMDDHIGRIFQALEEKKELWMILSLLLQRTMEKNLGELGIYGEHGTADQATCRIPMIIRWPGMTQGRVEHGLHYHLDLLPTVAELLGKRTERKLGWYKLCRGLKRKPSERKRLSSRFPMCPCVPTQCSL
ncbi:hypothetical protein GCM10020331_013720 [Ectobacillus funiculus]